MHHVSCKIISDTTQGWTLQSHEDSTMHWHTGTGTGRRQLIGFQRPLRARGHTAPAREETGRPRGATAAGSAFIRSSVAILSKGG